MRESGNAGRRSGLATVRPLKAKQNLTVPLLCGIAILVLHIFLFPPVKKLNMDFPGVGEIAPHQIRAPFTFEAPLAEQDVEMLRLQKVVVEPPVLKADAHRVVEASGTRMELWLNSVEAALQDSISTMDEKVGFFSLQFPGIGQVALNRLLSSDPGDSVVIRMEKAWKKVLAGGVVDVLPPGRYDRVVVATQGSESFRNRSSVVSQAELQDRLTSELIAEGFEPVMAVGTASQMRHFVRPNLVYSAQETRLRQELARNTVVADREFIKGERIIDQGVRVTPQQELFLNELEQLMIAAGAGDSQSGQLTRFFSRTVLLAFTLGLFGWFGHVHFPGSLYNVRIIVALSIILAVFLVGSSFSLGTLELGVFGVPVILLSLLGTVLFRDKVGYNVTLLGVTLVAVLPGYSAGQVLAWYFLGMVTVGSVRRIRRRAQFYQTILVLTFLSISLIFLLEQTGSAPNTGDYLVGVFAPVLLVAFGLFMLPVIEPLVGVCSDLTLLELSDLNHPLLQRMALEAQGTYHHSQVVGQLSEHAARAIDANSLLTRVGALFHDIGKMEKPEYYVENQNVNRNKHDELSPSMSALIIGAHVKDGIELGRKWRLPQAVIDFIPEHHGTMVMEYFYHKALSSDSNASVKVDDFRYPGPKPRSRETAILMLADAAEAATRSLAKPTASRIREITKQVIDKRALSGEMDESGLTLSDLARIRESFIPLLTGIHHSRIVYPGQRGKDSESVPEKKGKRKSRQ
ncbi:MAG: HDIG domain-containing protein [bacterium]|nr:HDIG domain-containing protein [bacterium]